MKFLLNLLISMLNFQSYMNIIFAIITEIYYLQKQLSFTIF